jgi:hypothetical protein
LDIVNRGLTPWRENNSEATKPKPEVKDLAKLYQLIVWL